MTKVYLSGLLAKYFGSFFIFKLNSAISALKAIDANKEGFLKKLIEFNNSGYYYQMIINGNIINKEEELIEIRKINTIHIVPCIIGYGAELVTKIVISAIVSTILSVASSLIMSALNKQAAPPQRYQAIGGTVGSIESAGKNYIFNNQQNVASQGAAVPLGYGRIKIGTNILMTSIKNYPTSIKFENETRLFINNLDMS